jgi:hypothetical protein
MTNVASNSPAAKAEASHRDEANRAERDRGEVEQVLGAGSRAANPMGLLKKMHTFDYATEAELFDYSTEAELFSTKGKNSRRQSLGYKRFARAADAIRFAIEELPPQFLSGTYLEVDEARYESKEIRHLYESIDYPLVRRTAASSR